jgi:hypothetical protein
MSDPPRWPGSVRTEAICFRVIDKLALNRIKSNGALQGQRYAARQKRPHRIDRRVHVADGGTTVTNAFQEIA